MIGSILGVRYEITASIGDGPIFSAYIAHDRIQDRDVCVRFFRSPFDKEAEFVQAVGLAVGRSASVRSASVEVIWELDSYEGAPFFVGELTRGAPAAERIRKLAPFSASVSIGTALSVLEGLAALHAAGIVHGDVGAANVIIELDGSAKLQLGGVWEAYRASQTAGAVVLPHLAASLAPEVSAGGQPSPASDLYAVGVLLFQLLTGRLPYPAETPLSMALKHATDPIPSARALNPSIPRVLEEILKRALAKEPSARYATASEMSADLRALQEALRFGKSIGWPIRHGAPAATHRPVAPQMSATRLSRRFLDEEAEETSDLPVWLRSSLLIGLALLCGLVLTFLLFNVRKPRMVPVPNVRNMTLSEARSALKGAHLEVRVQSHVPNEKVPAESVVDVVPGPGVEVREGSEVAVRLSTGSRFVEVPELNGRTIDEAKAILGALGLELDERVDTMPSSEVPKGKIVAQAPSARTRVDRGSHVHPSVSAGAAASRERPIVDRPKVVYTLKMKLTGLDGPTRVKVEMTDDDGTSKIFDEQRQPDDNVEIVAEGRGAKATFRVYYGGTLVKTVTKEAETERPK